MNAAVLNKAVDRTFDALLTQLDCTDGTDAVLISHWQASPEGFRIQVSRKADGATRTKFVTSDGNVRA